ncbi:MAG: Phosphoglycerate kinase [Parcubacteria group bacterium GW2011_GWA1_Parcubacteria_45_10]|nr:MAG: Phosphoglycerate kinase [Parcubacteria group bacterium GW2011_GWA1_Parcubacteria_45_10]
MRFLPKQSFFKNKQVLLRVDFNVELRKNRVLDDFRIRQTLPTIKYLQKNAARLVLISHLSNETESLAPVAKHLAKLSRRKVFFVPGKISSAAKLVNALPKKSVVLLENLRFDKGEKANQPAFARKLAGLADVFVFDAFGVSHRKDASVVGVPKLLPSFAGLLMENELKSLEKLKKQAKKPFVAIFGGAKMETKLPLIKNFAKRARATPEALVRRADYVLLGGALANTFLKAKGVNVGKSLYEKKFVSRAKKLLKNKKIILPDDYLVAQSLGSRTSHLFSVVSHKLSVGGYIGDIGPTSTKEFSKIISRAKTIIWNGPMGYYENPVFARATFEVAKAVLANKKAFKIIGGGDTTAFLKNAKLPITNYQLPNLFISTGGGAMLEYLSGKELPGVAVLEKSWKR